MLHRQRAAEAAFEQTAAQYRGAVLTGFQNVADALYALQADAEGLRAALAAERAAKRTLDITLKQQELGAVSYLALLSARQVYQQALISRAAVAANLATPKDHRAPLALLRTSVVQTAPTLTSHSGQRNQPARSVLS